jgi:uncharacterized protein (TIGR03435 family)
MTLPVFLLMAGGAVAMAAPQAAPAPVFEVASIRPTQEGTPRSMRATPRGISYTRINLKECIAEAYQVTTGQISGSPLLAARYDIVANAAEAVTNEQRRLMLQALLADRFKLTLHRESKDLAVYRLIVGKDGAKLHEAGDEGEATSGLGRTGLTFHNTSMFTFAAFLTGLMERPVLDQTALSKNYDFTLLPENLEAVPDAQVKNAMREWSTASIFTDIQRQLGLKLEAGRAPVDFLIVDRLAKPSEN